MNGTLGCERARISLGVYVLGAIDPAERAAVDAHLSGCAECRAEFADLGTVPALLATVSAEDAAGLTERDAAAPLALSANLDRPAPRPASLSAKRNRRNRRNRRGTMRTAVAAVAAAVLVALAGLAGALLSGHPASGQAPSPGAALGPWRTATGDGTAGMQAIVRYRPMGWGTQVAVMVKGIPLHSTCSIEAIGPGGTRSSAGSWVTDDSEGSIWYSAGTSLRGDRLSRFLITVDGRPAVTTPA